MACKYCGETDPLKLTMNTRMIYGKAVTVDVCFSCGWIEKFESNKRKMEMDGEILRKADWKGIYKDREFLEFLGMFYKRERKAAAPELGKGN